MTECERLIADGMFKPDFFFDSISCNYRVTKKMKKVWAIEIDLLYQLHRICKKHCLTYYLISGTLLGAIRHNGFIPWDDDIDIVMMRSDYEKLLKLHNEFTFPYFLQTPETDPNGYFSFAKLRNSNTTAVSYCFQYNNFNQGIGLDIFPMDEWDPNDKEESFSLIKKYNLDISTLLRSKSPRKEDQLRVSQYRGLSLLENYCRVNQIATQYNGKCFHYLSVLVCTISKNKLWCKEDFSHTIVHEFEGFEFDVPIGYNNVLTESFGDYMTYPPVELRGINHSNVILDPDLPYISYLL